MLPALAYILIESTYSMKAIIIIKRLHIHYDIVTSL